MRSYWAGIAALGVAAALAAPMVGAGAAYAATQDQASTIIVNGQVAYTPDRFTYANTTYMPIWYVMQVMKQLGIATTWDGNTHVWSVSAADVASGLHIHATGGKTTIELNGSAVEQDVPTRIAVDPKSGVDTTFMPIWYVQQLLNTLGTTADAWDGTTGTWTLAIAAANGGSGSGSGSGGTAGAGGGSGSAGSGSGAGSASVGSAAAGAVGQLGLYNSNAATSDSAWWQRADGNLYLTVQTLNPDTSSTNASAAGPSLTEVEPGQTLYLFAQEPNASVSPDETTWFVNSADATITPSQTDWTYQASSSSPTYNQAKADFVASAPGIYTVQADVDGSYSVPLVITVGMSQLQSTPYASAAVATGILPLPTDLPYVAPTTQSGVTFSPYPAQGQWLPVAGTTSTSVSRITVLLQSSSNSNDYWDYELPVTNGSFGGLLFSPYTGSMDVILFPGYFKATTAAMDANQAVNYPNSYYAVNVTGSEPSQQTWALLASAHRDFNMSPSFAATADILLENSRSLHSAVEAINNYASEEILYDNAEDVFNAQGFAPGYIWQDTLTAWMDHSGVCEDLSNLAVSLLESVGIPAQTVGGYADANWTSLPATDSKPQDAHQWGQAWVDGGWLPFDPTWTADQSSNTAVWEISNQFFGDTPSLATTHLGESDQIGTPSVRGPAAIRRLR